MKLCKNNENNIAVMKCTGKPPGLTRPPFFPHRISKYLDSVESFLYYLSSSMSMTFSTVHVLIQNDKLTKLQYHTLLVTCCHRNTQLCNAIFSNNIPQWLGMLKMMMKKKIWTSEGRFYLLAKKLSFIGNLGGSFLDNELIDLLLNSDQPSGGLTSYICTIANTPNKITEDV